VMGTGGTPVGRTPCSNLCANPTRFVVPPTYQNTMLGTGAACLETTSALTGWTCGNMTGRTFSINGRTEDCAALPAPADIPVRSGGYCFQASAGGQSFAFFDAF
jgi:hypothetical protein